MALVPLRVDVPVLWFSVLSQPEAAILESHGIEVASPSCQSNGEEGEMHEFADQVNHRFSEQVGFTRCYLKTQYGYICLFYTNIFRNMKNAGVAFQTIHSKLADEAFCFFNLHKKKVFLSFFTFHILVLGSCPTLSFSLCPSIGERTYVEKVVCFNFFFRETFF